jgi:hypothetical protein
VHVGDAVYKSDVVETGANSSCGIGFPDGTALDLVAGTRMALNDYSFDANGASNNALFTLVEGTFAFVAGQVAHTGSGMKIATPVATMGIPRHRRPVSQRTYRHQFQTGSRLVGLSARGSGRQPSPRPHRTHRPGPDLADIRAGLLSVG